MGKLLVEQNGVYAASELDYVCSASDQAVERHTNETAAAEDDERGIETSAEYIGPRRREGSEYVANVAGLLRRSQV